MRFNNSLCAAAVFCGAEAAGCLGRDFFTAVFLTGFLAVFADVLAGAFFTAFAAFGAFALATDFLPAGFLVRVRAKIL